MLTVIISNTVNGIHYTFAVLEKPASITELDETIKENLLKNEKKMLKIWNAGTSLTANVYLDGNFSASIDFEL